MTADSTNSPPFADPACLEILVLRTVIEPLRQDWEQVLADAVDQHHQGNGESAAQTCRDFLRQLSQTIILDPACGAGALLCVALEHMKRLEEEVREATANFSGSRQREADAFYVGVHQFLGIEIDSRAAAAARLSLRTACLKWRPDAHETAHEPAPEDYQNIRCRDALLNYYHAEPLLNKKGQPITRWDGTTLKPHPTTGESVPDHNFRVPVLRYVNPRKSRWPAAHFIIGKLPFTSPARVRDALGDSYMHALRAAHPEIPDYADLAMYWWNHAADTVRSGMGISPANPPVIPSPSRSDASIRNSPEGSPLRRFGFITSHRIRQSHNRPVLQRHLGTGEISLAFAIPDHPVIKPTGADTTTTRIAITVAQSGIHPGLLQESRMGIPVCPAPIQAAQQNPVPATSSPPLPFNSTTGLIHPDLTAGADVASAHPLQSNAGVAYPGMQPLGEGFIVSPFELPRLKQGRAPAPDLGAIIRPYMSGRDLTQTSRGVLAIDLFGHDLETVQTRYPEIYQWVYDRVKPERAANRCETHRENWWTFSQPRPQLRAALAGLPRYIATVKSTKHRLFVFLDAAVLPDEKLVAIALGDAFYLGVLSSRIHGAWAAAAGRNFDVDLSPTYTISRCFDSFPFPTATPAQTDQIRDLAERLDAHRKRQQNLHPRLTLTMCYNVLQKQRAGETLSPKDRAIQDDGLVNELHQLHDKLDAAVANAYNWPIDLTEAEAVSHLVNLNHHRAAEEGKGRISYLRRELVSEPASIR